MQIMKTYLIGIDDTDNATSRGTGHLARQLAKELKARGAKPLSITRHQLLVDPRIPYTSHNSGACIAVESPDGPDALAFAFDYVQDSSAEGSDPGVCVIAADDVPEEIMEFGRSATSEVLEMDDAISLAGRLGIRLRPLGGTGLGVIGALGSVGLRTWGNEGRFIHLPGLRKIPDKAASEDITKLGIELDYRGAARKPADTDVYETFGWVRPRLVAGRPVLPVEWNEEYDAWIIIYRQKSRPLE